METFLFGDESDSDARFIQLEECNHIIESNGLITWMQTDTTSQFNSSDEKNETELMPFNSNRPRGIQSKKCPKECKAIIRKTSAVRKFTQASIMDVEKVKSIRYGSTDETDKMQRDLNDKVSQFLGTRIDRTNNPLNMLPIFAAIKMNVFIGQYDDPDEFFNNWGTSKIPQKYKKSKPELIELGNKFDACKKIYLLFRVYSTKGQFNHATTWSIMQPYLKHFELRVQSLVEFVKTFKNSPQAREDLHCEMKMIKLIGDSVKKIRDRGFTTKGHQLIQEAFELTVKRGAPSDSLRDQFVELINRAGKCETSGLQITIEEKKMILRTMGLSAGHWYKCPNGHVYAIGDCGGAMEVSTCPDCKSKIGGESHRLKDDNAVAPEMDGATKSAWS